MLRVSSQQDPGYEKAGQHEEDVDADETAVEHPELGVERDDEVDRDRAQSVEIGPVLVRSRRYRHVDCSRRSGPCRLPGAFGLMHELVEKALLRGVVLGGVLGVPLHREEPRLGLSSSSASTMPSSARATTRSPVPTRSTAWW